MNLTYVDRPAGGRVRADFTTGATLVDEIVLTDHAFILGLHNPTNDTVDVRIDVWSEQHDHFTETIRLRPTVLEYCKVADIPGNIARYQVDAQHGGRVYYEVYTYA